MLCQACEPVCTVAGSTVTGTHQSTNMIYTCHHTLHWCVFKLNQSKPSIPQYFSTHTKMMHSMDIFHPVNIDYLPSYNQTLILSPPVIKHGLSPFLLPNITSLPSFNQPWILSFSVHSNM